MAKSGNPEGIDLKTSVLVTVYVAAMSSANLLVAALGPWVSPLNSFVFIGLDLTLRDKLHDAWRGDARKMGALVLSACVISYAINPASGMIALASFVAFAASAAVDWIVYGRLGGGYMKRVNGSNAAGAAVDSLLFPTIAFGALMPPVIAAQFFAKVGGGYFWSLVFRGRHG